MPRFLSAVTFLPSSCPTVFTQTWRTFFSSGAIQANFLPSGESLRARLLRVPEEDVAGDDGGRGRVGGEGGGERDGESHEQGGDGHPGGTRGAWILLAKRQVVREPRSLYFEFPPLQGRLPSGASERPATPSWDGSRDGDGSGRRARRHRLVRSVRGDGADAPGGPRGGALAGRRLRRPLLPAPRRDRPGARGRGGEPRLRLGRAGRGRAGGEGGPDRLRLHRGPVAPGHPGRGPHRGGHRRRGLARRPGPDAPRVPGWAGATRRSRRGRGRAPRRACPSSSR